jgi:hypothetical protein
VIVSETAFLWIISAILAGFSGFWLVRDIFFLRAVRRGETDPVIRRDKAFGALMGMIIGAIGVAGVLRYHLGL